MVNEANQVRELRDSDITWVYQLLTRAALVISRRLWEGRLYALLVQVHCTEWGLSFLRGHDGDAHWKLQQKMMRICISACSTRCRSELWPKQQRDVLETLEASTPSFVGAIPDMSGIEMIWEHVFWFR